MASSHHLQGLKYTQERDCPFSPHALCYYFGILMKLCLFFFYHIAGVKEIFCFSDLC